MGVDLAQLQLRTLMVCAREIDKARIAGNDLARAECRDEIGEARRRPEDTCCASFAEHLLTEDTEA